MTDKPIILTKPDQIRAYGLLQLKHQLQMEVNNPNGPKWKVKPGKTCRKILIDAGLPDPGPLKKNILVSYIAYLEMLEIPT